LTKKYAIKEILDMKMIIPQIEIVEKLKPDHIKVSKEEYQDFMSKNDEYIKDYELNTVSERIFYYDFYENMIGGVEFSNYDNRGEYYINPELFQLGIEKKMEINNITKVVGEEVIELGVPKSCDIGIGYIDGTNGGSGNYAPLNSSYNYKKKWLSDLDKRK